MRVKALLPNLAGVFLLVGLALGSALGAAADTLKLLVQRSYLPGVPVLVRVEKLDSRGEIDRALWDADVALSVNPGGVTLSSNMVHLRNGMGSTLVSFTNGGDFDLTATLGALTVTRTLATATNLPVSTFGGALTESNTVWSGVVRMTNDVTVPTGYTLTILSISTRVFDRMVSV